MAPIQTPNRESLDDARFLFRSRRRLAILSALCSQPLGLRELSDELDVPRTTLNDNLSAMESRDWLADRRGTYEATAYGRTVYEAVDSVQETLDVARRLQPFLEYVHDETEAIDASVFDDPTVTVAEPSHPHAPKDRLVEMITQAGTLRSIMPVSYPSLVDPIQNALSEGDLELEVVLERSVLRQQPPETHEAFEEHLETDALRVGLYDGSLQYGLGITDDEVVLASTDDAGLVRALVESSAPSAREWARDTYERYRTSSVFLD